MSDSKCWSLFSFFLSWHIFEHVQFGSNWIFQSRFALDMLSNLNEEIEENACSYPRCDIDCSNKVKMWHQTEVG